MPAKVILDYVVKIATDAAAGKGALGSFANEAKKAGAAAAGVAAGFAAVGVAAVAMANRLTGAVDRINTMSAQAGITASEFKALDAVAMSTGKSLGDILPKDLPKRIADAARGTGEAKAAFDALGISVTNADGTLRSGSEVLRDTINALGGVADETTRAALAQQALGMESQQLITAMSDTRALDAWERFATVYGTDVGPAAAETTQQWQRSTAMLAVAWDGMLSTMRPVVDIMVKMIDGFAAMVAMAKGAKDELVAGGWGGLTNGTVRAMRALEGARKGYEQFKEEYVALRLAIEGDDDGGDEFVGPPMPDPALSAPAKSALRHARAAPAAAAAMAAPIKVEIVAVDLLPSLSEDLPAAIQDGLDELEGTLQSAMIEAGHINAAAISELADDTVGEFQGMLGTIQDLAELPAGIMATMDSLATSLEMLPEMLAALPEVVARSVLAANELVPMLIAQLPTILLESVKAAFVVALNLTGIPAVLSSIASLFEFLPGRFAESIADALRYVLRELNPFDGGFFGQTAEKVKDKIPFFETGGDVARTGLAVVHSGERVLSRAETAAMARGIGGGGSIVVNSPDPYNAARAVRQAIGPMGPRLRLGGM